MYQKFISEPPFQTLPLLHHLPKTKMSNSQLQRLNCAPSFSLLPKLPSNILINGTNPSLHILPKHHYFPRKYRKSSILATSRDVKPASSRPMTVTEKPVTVKAVVTVQATVGGLLSNLGITRPVDDITDLLGKTFRLELVSNQLDSRKHLQSKL